MSAISSVKEFFRVSSEFTSVLGVMASLRKMPTVADKDSLGLMFERSVAKSPNSPFLLCEGKEWTYGQFNSEVNQLAHYFQKKGLGRGDVIALYMENRAAYIQSALAMAKLGVTASLINNSLTGTALAHCINTSNAKACLVGEECTAALGEVLDQLNLEAGKDFFCLEDEGGVETPVWLEDVDPSLELMPTTNLAVTGEILAGETAFNIFTSGTTGLPKAAVLPHRKIIISGTTMGQAGFQAKPSDRLYLCLPIYHITGMGPGLASFIAAGGSIYLRRRFSASSFWKDVQQYQTNCFIYVGELCRYLLNNPPCEEEKNNPIVKVMGNGLRPEIWDEFKSRFGIERVAEIYGASEGNVAFINVLNKNKTIGAAMTPVELVKYDYENNEIVRDKNGLCIPVALGEPGLLLGEINEKAQFDGYTDPEASKKKVVNGVLAQNDRWFNTGDIVKQIDVGFSFGLKHFQFVDRTGDTFRWRAENVSTNEVSEVINAHPQVNVANVYGVEVPGCEGRAGMAAIQIDENTPFDWNGLKALLENNLPVYARPLFVRVQRNLETTATFKLVKNDLRKESYHPDKVGLDLLYSLKPESGLYEPLENEFYEALCQGQSGY
jgi:citronellyl-CoA synthetase